MRALVFPGQGAQFEGMGKDLYENHKVAQKLFDEANEILGFGITEVMFGGTAQELQQTKVTQPAIFLHAYITAAIKGIPEGTTAMAGHSLGEFTALAVSGALAFPDALSLVYQRALAMQQACETTPGTMAAILGLDDEVVEKICATIEGDVVVAANYNCPGQLVISGTLEGVQMACEKMKEAGAARALVLQVGGAFHSPLMAPARETLRAAIEKTQFATPKYTIFQNVDALPYTDPQHIKQNLIQQLTAPVRWTQTVRNMLAANIQHFTEVGGTGKVLLGMIKKVERSATTDTL